VRDSTGDEAQLRRFDLKSVFQLVLRHVRPLPRGHPREEDCA
jgi:hypothetical protein